jgi:hypothetical protein
LFGKVSSEAGMKRAQITERKFFEDSIEEDSSK